MGEVLGQVLPIAVGLMVSPMVIVAVVLMLASKRAVPNALAFLGGWVLAIAMVGSLVLVVVGAGTERDAEPATWVGWLKFALGLGLLLLAFRQLANWRQDGKQRSTPKWMAAIDGFGPPKALGLSFLLGVVNPKNLLLEISAATTIAHAGGSPGEQFAVLAMFTALASVGAAAPVVLYLVMGERSARFLAELRGWLTANNAVIMASLLLALGVKMIGDGVTALF